MSILRYSKRKEEQEFQSKYKIQNVLSERISKDYSNGNYDRISKNGLIFKSVDDKNLKNTQEQTNNHIINQRGKVSPLILRKKPIVKNDKNELLKQQNQRLQRQERNKKTQILMKHLFANIPTTTHHVDEKVQRKKLDKRIKTPTNLRRNATQLDKYQAQTLYKVEVKQMEMMNQKDRQFENENSKKYLKSQISKSQQKVFQDRNLQSNISRGRKMMRLILSCREKEYRQDYLERLRYMSKTINTSFLNSKDNTQNCAKQENISASFSQETQPSIDYWKETVSLAESQRPFTKIILRKKAEFDGSLKSRFKLTHKKFENLLKSSLPIDLLKDPWLDKMQIGNTLSTLKGIDYSLYREQRTEIEFKNFARNIWQKCTQIRIQNLLILSLVCKLSQISHRLMAPLKEYSQKRKRTFVHTHLRIRRNRRLKRIHALKIFLRSEKSNLV